MSFTYFEALAGLNKNLLVSDQTKLCLQVFCITASGPIFLLTDFHLIRILKKYLRCVAHTNICFFHCIENIELRYSVIPILLFYQDVDLLALQDFQEM